MISIFKDKDHIAFTALIAFSILWLLYVPAIHELPYFVMPPHCAVISEHTDAGGRYADFFKIKGVKIISKAFGLKPDKLSKDSGTETLIRLTTGKTTLIGFSDMAGPDSEPTLFGASCCGWRGSILKLMLATRWIPGLGRLNVTDNGIKYLLIDEDEPDGLKAAFAIHDNTLLATLSYNPEVIRELEYRAVHKLQLAKTYRTESPWDERAKCLHRFWINGAYSADLAVKYRKEIEKVAEIQIPDFISAKFDVRELSDDDFNAVLSLETFDSVFGNESQIAPLKGTTIASKILPLDQSDILLVLPEKEAARLTVKYISEVTLSKQDSVQDSVLTLCEGEIGPDFKVQGIQIPALTAFLPGVVIPRTALDKYGSPCGTQKNASQTEGAKVFPKSVTVDILYKQLKKAVNHMSFLFDKESLKKELIAFSPTEENGTILCSSFPSLNKQFSSPYAGLSNDWQKWLSVHNQNHGAVAYMRINMGKTLTLAGKITSALQLISSFIHIEGLSRDTISSASQFIADSDFSGYLNFLLFKEAENKISLEIGN